jgi:hypothetical protein
MASPRFLNQSSTRTNVQSSDDNLADDGSTTYESAPEPRRGGGKETQSSQGE